MYGHVIKRIYLNRWKFVSEIRRPRNIECHVCCIDVWIDYGFEGAWKKNCDFFGGIHRLCSVEGKIKRREKNKKKNSNACFQHKLEMCEIKKRT